MSGAIVRRVMLTVTLFALPAAATTPTGTPEHATAGAPSAGRSSVPAGVRLRLAGTEARLGLARARLVVGGRLRGLRYRRPARGVAAAQRIAGDWRAGMRAQSAVTRLEIQRTELREGAGLQTTDATSPLPTEVQRALGRAVSASVHEQFTPEQQQALMQTAAYPAMVQAAAEFRRVYTEVMPVMQANDPGSRSVEAARRGGYYEAQGRLQAAARAERTAVINAVREVAPAMASRLETR